MIYWKTELFRNGHTEHNVLKRVPVIPQTNTDLTKVKAPRLGAMTTSGLYLLI